MEAFKQISIDTNEAEFRGYRNLLMDHNVLVFICRHTKTSSYVIPGPVKTRGFTNGY